MLTDDGYGDLPTTEVDPAGLGIFSCGKPRLDDSLTAQALAYTKPGRASPTWSFISNSAGLDQGLFMKVSTSMRSGHYG